MPRWIVIFLAVVIAAFAWAVNRRPTTPAAAALPGQSAFSCVLPPPALAGQPPLQTSVPATMVPFRRGDYQLTPLAGFSLDARVLSREDYRFDRGAELSPTDLALGWQGMADPANYRRLDISQSGRWYQYRWGSEGPPLPLEQIIRSSANMHLIPANENVARALDRVRPDQGLRLQGWLVAVSGPDGFTWRSSLTRDDSGGGACELVYVCAVSTY